MTAVKEIFGNSLKGINTVTSRDPHSFKELLLSPIYSMRSSFIVVESTNMKEELLTKSNSTVYQDLLKTASWKVGKNIFRLFFFSRRSMRLEVLSGRKKERDTRGRHATRGERERCSLSRSRSSFHPNTSKCLLRRLVMFCLHTSQLYIVYLGFVFWPRVEFLGHACKRAK